MADKPRTKLTPTPQVEGDDAWYAQRYDALIEGDTGVLPDGQTCLESRQAIEELATTPPEPPPEPPVQNGAAH